jgi:uncharacterized protein
MEMLLTKDLIQAILDQYRLSVHGIHGISHWARVYENGQRLAGLNGADTRVVALFAIFHDACRQSDRTDDDHGRRGADLANSLRGKLFELSDPDFETLYRACALHTDGLTVDEAGGPAAITVETCWDSDRLDLPRAGIPIQPKRLSTQAARRPDVLAWAYKRSLTRQMPAWVEGDWLPKNGRDRTTE